MIKLGIECENLEDEKSRWGIGQMVLNLMKEYEKNLEWQKEYKLYLYFNQFIPDDEVLRNPVFTKKIVGSRSLKSFNIFYHILMPIRALRDNLDFMFFPAYMMSPLYYKKAIVTLTNDVYYEYKTGSLPFKYKLAYRLFTNWAAKFAYKVLAISETSKKEVARLYNIPLNKIFVSRLGGSLSHGRVGNISSKLNEKNYILYVGQMFPRRHAKETILAFEMIAKEKPELNLVLVGRDKYKKAMMASLIAEINNKLGEKRVIHYEYIESDDEISRLYQNALLDIYVSDSEAFGLPPVESASFGVPVVVMDNELNHELFGNSAFCAKSGSSLDIADSLREGLDNLEKRNRFKEDYKTITSRLNWANFAKNFFENVK